MPDTKLKPSSPQQTPRVGTKMNTVKNGSGGNI